MKSLFVTALLLVALAALSLRDHQLFRRRWHSANAVVSFDYTAENKIDLQNSKIVIEWNGQIMSTIVPIDHLKHQVSLKITAKIGENILKISKVGTSDPTLIKIENLKVQRPWIYRRYTLKHGGENLLKDNNLGDLSALKEIDVRIYLGKHNVLLSKERYKELKEREKLLTLDFHYAARQNYTLADSRFAVFWNGEKIKDITPKNYDQIKESFEVKPIAGKNTLEFKGLGERQDVGCGIQRVYLNGFHYFNKLDHGFKIKNGWFEDERFKISKEQTIFDEEAKFWKGNGSVKITMGETLNSHWQKGYTICQLSGNHSISQDVYLNETYYLVKPPYRLNNSEMFLQFSYTAQPGAELESSRFKVVWNDEIILDLIPIDYKKHFKTIKVNSRVGANSLHFVGAGSDPHKGAGVTYVQLLRKWRSFKPSNIVSNSKFIKYDQGCSNQHWSGNNIRILPGKEYNHSWGYESVGCVCALHPGDDVHFDFQLDSNYQYIDPRQKQLSLKIKKTVQFQYSYFAEPGINLNDSRFMIEWNGKIVKEVTPIDYKRHIQSCKMQIEAGKNVLRLLGNGNTEGKGVGFNWVRLSRESNFFHPTYLISSDLMVREYNGPCPSYLPKWKGDSLALIKAKDFAGQITADCVFQLQRNQQIYAEFSFNNQYQGSILA